MSYVESVQRAIDYIEEHLDQELDVFRIADEAYISVAQLYRVFYALTGHPVKDYIRKRRMSVAANHLRNSKRTVEELAWESGFESYHSFAKVFKKIVGLTPAAYRHADIYFSFEQIRLREQFDYMEDRMNTERYPDVKVIRFMPDKVYAYLHTSDQLSGIENEAYQVISMELDNLDAARNLKSKARIFGYNVDLPAEGDKVRRGYRILIADGEEWMVDGMLSEESFPGGLYAVRKVAASPPETVQDGWNRLLSEWLPKSTFEIGEHQYIEEFIAYNGKVTRMNLFLPVQRKLQHEPIEVVDLAEAQAFFCRGYGAEAQSVAEQRLINWYESGPDGSRQLDGAKYYMSFHYGHPDSELYWWENGIVTGGSEFAGVKGLEEKRLGSGLYACCVSKTYGLLTGVLDLLHRWIATSDVYRLDEDRQWFAEYHTFDGMNVERDTVVKVYIPICTRS